MHSIMERIFVGGLFALAAGLTWSHVGIWSWVLALQSAVLLYCNRGSDRGLSSTLINLFIFLTITQSSFAVGLYVLRVMNPFLTNSSFMILGYPLVNVINFLALVVWVLGVTAFTLLALLSH